jgi:acyl carrier protein
MNLSSSSDYGRHRKADIKERLHAMFEERYPSVFGLGDGDFFVDHGALSSLKLMEMVVDLEATFGIRIYDDEIGEENLGNKESLYRFLESKLAS